MISKERKLPVFRGNGQFVLCSFKVMFSFCNSEKNLKKEFWSRKNIHHAIINSISGYPKMVFLYRDPIKRFVSFFNDKFRKEPLRIINSSNSDSDCEGCEVLQSVQLSYLRHVGLESGVIASCNSLLNAKPEDVVSWLERKFLEDGHTIPQSHSLFARWRRITVRLKPSVFLNIGSDDDVKRFGELLNVNTSRKKNSTMMTPGRLSDLELSPECIDVLRNLYFEDYALIENIEQR